LSFEFPDARPILDRFPGDDRNLDPAAGRKVRI